MTTVSQPPGPEVVMLADRLRNLREHEFRKLTQTFLGHALKLVGEPASPATISMWENSSSGRIIPNGRIEGYARLFCTARSFDGPEPRLIPLEDLTTAERDRFEALQRELLDLHNRAVTSTETSASRHEARSMWHYPDGARVTLVCSRLPDKLQPPHASRDHLNYVRASGLADLDTLIDIYGAVRAFNPTARIRIMAAQDLVQRDIATHLVLIGGLAWQTVEIRVSQLLPIPIQPEDPAARGAIVVRVPGGQDKEFTYTLARDPETGRDELVEDVGFFARGPNPQAPQRTLTICGGITTRGVHGAAKCFTDPELRGRNVEWLRPQFPDGSRYCILMRVPVVNRDALTPDLSREETRLFMWCDASTESS